MKNLAILFTVMLVLFCGNEVLAQKGFLKMGDIKGESTQSGHKDWIVIEGFSQALEQPAQRTGVARARSSVDFADIIVTKKADKSSPKLMELCAKGQVLPELEFSLLGANNRTFYKVTLSNVRISSIRSNAVCDPECEVIEEFSLNYSKISWEYSDSKGEKTMSSYNAQTGN